MAIGIMNRCNEFSCRRFGHTQGALDFLDRERFGGVVARTNQNGPEHVVNDLTEGIGAEPAFGGEVEGVVVGLGDGVVGDVVEE